MRGAGHSWAEDFLGTEPNPEALNKLSAITDILTSGGRTLVQGSLGWIWARSNNASANSGFLKQFSRLRKMPKLWSMVLFRRCSG